MPTEICNEYYVSLELAQLLKEKNIFHEPVGTWYSDSYDDEDSPIHKFEIAGASIPSFVQDWNDLKKFPILHDEEYMNNDYSAPRLAHVQQWLMNKYNIAIAPAYVYVGKNIYYWEIGNISRHGKIIDNGNANIVYKSYPDALEEAIKIALKYI